MIGSVQQPVEEKDTSCQENSEEWWAIGSLCEKEEEEDGVAWKEFTSKEEANKAWRIVSRDFKAKAGRAALLVNCRTRKEVGRLLSWREFLRMAMRRASAAAKMRNVMRCPCCRPP